MFRLRVDEIRTLQTHRIKQANDFRLNRGHR